MKTYQALNQLQSNMTKDYFLVQDILRNADALPEGDEKKLREIADKLAANITAVELISKTAKKDNSILLSFEDKKPSDYMDIEMQGFWNTCNNLKNQRYAEQN